MLVEIDINTIKRTLPEIKMGVDKYLNLMDSLHRCDVSQDREFQKLYNGFYRMRQRSQEFYQKYFEYMELHKSSMVSFEEVLSYLHDATERFEPSFASKLLATIRPDMPVWDVNVLSNLEITPPRYYQKNRLAYTVKTYSVLENWYARYLKTQNAKEIICLFDKVYPDKQITDVKKIDLALWSLGEKKAEDIT